MMHRRYLGLAIVAGTLSLANAQTDPPTRTPSTNRGDLQDPSRLGSAGSGDTLLATWLIADNEKEIALAQVAQQRAQDPEVKQFAERMIKDHEQMIQKLRPFAGGMDEVGRRGAGGTGMDRSGAGGERVGAGAGQGGTGQTGAGQGGTTTRPAAGAQGRREVGDPTTEGKEGRVADASGTRERQLGQPGGTLDHIALIRELGRKCTETATRDLESKQGAEFDRCYMVMAVMEHKAANDKLSVFRNHASDRLRTTLAEGQSTVQQHLDHAKQLAKKFEGTKTDGR